MLKIQVVNKNYLFRKNMESKGRLRGVYFPCGITKKTRKEWYLDYKLYENKAGKIKKTQNLIVVAKQSNKIKTGLIIGHELLHYLVGGMYRLFLLNHKEREKLHNFIDRYLTTFRLF